MPLYLTLVALFLGVAFHVEWLDRAWTVSYVDLLAPVLAVAGGVVAWRRRAVRLDYALLGYAGILAVVAAQVVRGPGRLDVVGGSTRFVTAALVLFGLQQLLAARQPAAASSALARRLREHETPWRWPLALVLFAAVLAAMAVVDLVVALADPELADFYAVKKAVEVPLGASNYLAAFLVVGAVVALTSLASGRSWLVPTIVVVMGLFATLSRGAFVAFGVALVVGALLLRDRVVLVRAGAALSCAVAVFVGVAAVASAVATGPAPEVVIAGSDAEDDAEATDLPNVPGAEPQPDRGPGIGQLDGALTTAATGGRRQLYAASWDAFTDHPVIGVGLNSLDTYTGRGGHPPHVNAHNLVLNALAVTGVLGAVAYLALWVVLGWRVLGMPAGGQRTALLLAATALLVHAQVEALTYSRAVEVLIAVMLALASAAPGARGVVDVPMRRRSLGAAGDRPAPG